MKGVSRVLTLIAVIGCAATFASVVAIAEDDQGKPGSEAVEPNGSNEVATEPPQDAAERESEMMASRPGGCPEWPNCPDESSTDSKAQDGDPPSAAAD